MKNKLSRKQPVRFDVDKLVDDFGGNTKISRMLREMGMPISPGADHKWKVRQRLPVHHLAALSVIARHVNQRFALEEYIVQVGPTEAA